MREQLTLMVRALLWLRPSLKLHVKYALSFGWETSADVMDARV